MFASSWLPLSVGWAALGRRFGEDSWPGREAEWGPECDLGGVDVDEGEGEGEDDAAKTDVRALRMGWRRAAKKAVKASKNFQALGPEGAVAS